MIRLKNKREIEILKEGGKNLANLLSRLVEEVRPGVSSKDLDLLSEKIIKEMGDKSSFLGYKPKGSKEAYPSSICVSVNDEVVHGEPKINPRVFKEGDIVSIDAGLIHGGLFTDSAITVPVGKIDASAKQLIRITKESLDVGIKVAKKGARIGDIGFAIEEFVRPYGFGIVRELAGHGVGFAVHEDPFVPNYGRPASGAKLEEGLVIAIEPMLNEGSEEIYLSSDSYSYKTVDGKRSAHFEHTVVISEGGAEIITKC